MGIFDSLIAWVILVFIVAAILFAVFNYFLGGVTEEEPYEEEDQQFRRTNSRKKIIWIFAVIAISIIMATTSYNAFTTPHK